MGQAKLSDEQRLEIKSKADDHAKELAQKLNRKVHCIFVDLPDEVVVGYIQEPMLRNKLAAVNYLGQKQVDMAGELILQTSLIKEESDERLIMGNDDDVYVSAVLLCNKLVKVFAGEIKKN